MASIVELAHGEKSRAQSITQSPSLFDAPGTEALASELLASTPTDYGWYAVTAVLQTYVFVGDISTASDIS